MLKRVLYTDDIQGSISVARGHESVATILKSISHDAGFDLTPLFLILKIIIKIMSTHQYNHTGDRWRSRRYRKIRLVEYHLIPLALS